MEIGFLSMIAIDSRRIRCVHGLASLKVFATTGEAGESKMEAHQVLLRLADTVSCGFISLNSSNF